MLNKVHNDSLETTKVVFDNDERDLKCASGESVNTSNDLNVLLLISVSRKMITCL